MERLGVDKYQSITVVVCTRDRPEQLQACLSVLGQQDYPRFDVLVVDNACAHPVEAIARRHGAACIHEPVPGLTRARNTGARAARGELVAYIDDDAIAEAGWLSALAREFADPAVAAVAGRTRYMKAEGESLRMTDEPAEDEVGPRPPRSVGRDTPHWFALACFGGIGDGNTMAFRRTALAGAPRFDERLGRGRLLDCGDEHVAFMRLIAEGHRVNHAPLAVVRHPFPPTLELRRVRRFRDLRSSIAYLVFLWFEFSAHRADIARFLARAVAKRLWSNPQKPALPAPLSRLAALRAMLGGALLYFRARGEWRAQPAAAPQAERFGGEQGAPAR